MELRSHEQHADMETLMYTNDLENPVCGAEEALKAKSQTLSSMCFNILFINCITVTAMSFAQACLK